MDLEYNILCCNVYINIVKGKSLMFANVGNSECGTERGEEGGR